MLRQATGLLNKSLRSRAHFPSFGAPGPTLTSNLQQQRFAGNLPVKPNKYIEDWAYFREHVELYFRLFDARNLRNLFLTLVVAPVGIYYITCQEFDNTDKAYNRPPRDFMADVKTHNDTHQH